MELKEQIERGKFERTGHKDGGEWSGPCPFQNVCQYCHDACEHCQSDCKWSGDDRFQIWPNHQKGTGGRFWCRKGGIHGDGVDFVEITEGISSEEALDMFDPEQAGGSDTDKETEMNTPPQWWRTGARTLVQDAHQRIQEEEDCWVWEYLRGRGVTDETISRFRLGWVEEGGNQTWCRYPTATLNRASRDQINEEEIFIPKGVVIPYFYRGNVVKVNVKSVENNTYRMISGSANALFNADDLTEGRKTILTEGELDCMILKQELSDEYSVVATGGTSNGRSQLWVDLLNQYGNVILAFDDDDAGNEAVRYWRRKLDESRVAQPYFGDVCEMFEYDVELHEWLT